MRWFVWILMLVGWMMTVVGCMHGPRLETYGPAHNPHGLTTQLYVIDMPVKLIGELLTVRDSSLVVATSSRIVEVAFSRIRDGKFPGASRLNIGAGRIPGPHKREELRLLSRFPQGLSTSVLSELLDTYDQHELELIGVASDTGRTSSKIQRFEHDEFVERARAASNRYTDLGQAIAAGFRKVGPEMPQMGEHWIRIRQVLRREIDPDDPTVLTYIRIDGEPVLTGVAYTIAVTDGEALPRPLPGAAWHVHSGTIEEELMGHEGGHDGPGLAMIHAWVWTDNPNGTFAADNWGLPFVRQGIDVPENVPPAAAKAVSLLHDVEYYLALVDAADDLRDERAQEIRSKFDTARARAQTILEHREVRTGDLSETWHHLWQDVRPLVSTEAWMRLEYVVHGVNGAAGSHN